MYRVKGLFHGFLGWFIGWFMEWFMEWFIGWRMEWLMGTRSTDQYTEAHYTSTKRKASDPFPKAPAWHKHKSD